MGSAEDRAEGAAHHCSRATFTGEFHRGGTTGPPPFGKRPAKTNASHQISHTCLILAPMGWPPAVGLQELVANHRKRRGSKARVVSVTEKASRGVRWETGRRTPVNCRSSVEKYQMTSKPAGFVTPGSVWPVPSGLAPGEVRVAACRPQPNHQGVRCPAPATTPVLHRRRQRMLAWRNGRCRLLYQ